MGGVMASAIVSAILFWPATHSLFPDGVMIANALRSANDLYFASLVGLLMTGIVVVITNYYTSMSYGPVRKIAKASETGHATNIIAGLAIGQHATALPVGFIGHRDPVQLSFRRSLRHRDRGHEHALDGRNHHLARRLRPDHR